MPVEGFLLEDASGRYKLEDGTGIYLLESSELSASTKRGSNIVPLYQNIIKPKRTRRRRGRH